MKIKPIGKRVLIKRVLEPSKTESGLFIPDDARDPSQHATVLAVGPKIEEDIFPGDIVITAKYVGFQIKQDDHTLFLVEEKDILAKVK